MKYGQDSEETFSPLVIMPFFVGIQLTLKPDVIRSEREEDT